MSVIDDDSALLKRFTFPHFVFGQVVACSLSIQLLKRFTTPNHDASANVDEDDKINQDDNNNNDDNNDDELAPAR